MNDNNAFKAFSPPRQSGLVIDDPEGLVWSQEFISRDGKPNEQNPHARAAAVAHLARLGVTDQAALREMEDAIRALDYVISDAKEMNKSPDALVKKRAAKAIESLTALRQALRCDRFRNLVQKALGEAGAPVTVADGISDTIRAARRVQESLSLMGRRPRDRQVDFVAREAGRFQRLTGLVPSRTKDPADGRLAGLFVVYVRLLCANFIGPPAISDHDVARGLTHYRSKMKPKIPGQTP